jgi:hypothetical protein
MRQSVKTPRIQQRLHLRRYLQQHPPRRLLPKPRLGNLRQRLRLSQRLQSHLSLRLRLLLRKGSRQKRGSPR